VVVTVNEAAIGQRVAPLYAGQAASLQRVLADRDATELRIISAFLRDLVDQPPETS